MEKTAFTVDDVSETSSNTRETQRSGSATVRPASVRPAQPRQPPCSAGFRGEPCEGERVRRHPHPGAVCVSETRSKNAVTSISLPLDANPCSQTAQPQGTDSAPQPLLRGTTGEAERWSGPEAQARVPREAARPEQPVCRGTAWKGHPPDAEPYEK